MVPEQSVQPEAGSSPGGGPSRVTGMAQGLEIDQFGSRPPRSGVGFKEGYQ